VRFNIHSQTFYVLLNNILYSYSYSGKHCEIDVNVCTNNNSMQMFRPTLCLNGGTCVEGPGDRYFCACVPGIYIMNNNLLFYIIIY